MASALTLSACAGSGQTDTATNVEFPSLDSEVRMQDPDNSAVTRMAAGSVPDCGGGISASRKQQLTISNFTDRELMLYVPDIDCYDWFGTRNPYQLSNQVLQPGQSFGPVTLEFQWNAYGTRAFDLDIFDCSNGAVGAPFCTIGRTRPVIERADIYCTDDSGSFTVCDGRTFCGKDSPDFQEQTATMNFNRVFKYEQISYPNEPVAPNPPLQLTVTTLCTPDTATLAITQ